MEIVWDGPKQWGHSQPTPLLWYTKNHCDTVLMVKIQGKSAETVTHPEMLLRKSLQSPSPLLGLCLGILIFQKQIPFTSAFVLCQTHWYRVLGNFFSYHNCRRHNAPRRTKTEVRHLFVCFLFCLLWTTHYSHKTKSIHSPKHSQGNEDISRRHFIQVLPGHFIARIRYNTLLPAVWWVNHNREPKAYLATQNLIARTKPSWCC